MNNVVWFSIEDIRVFPIQVDSLVYGDAGGQLDSFKTIHNLKDLCSLTSNSIVSEHLVVFISSGTEPYDHFVFKMGGFRPK